MSYSINKTDGSVLTEIVDGTLDQVSTDLTLFGKSSSSYGEFLNENFVKLLENFAKATSPVKPLEGQLWYDINEKRLKIYDGKNFRLTSGTLVSSYVPSSISQGDLWIDTTNHQLHFHDGTSVVLAGPFDASITGFKSVTATDIFGIGHVVMLSMVNEELFSILSVEDQPFTLAANLYGFTGIVVPGFNLKNLSKITNVDDASDSTDAVNKQTAERLINQYAPYAISLDITTYAGTVQDPQNKNPTIGTYLARIFPIGQFAPDSGDIYPRCRVVCTDDGEVSIRQFQLKQGSWQFEYEV